MSVEVRNLSVVDCVYLRARSLGRVNRNKFLLKINKLMKISAVPVLGQLYPKYFSVNRNLEIASSTLSSP